MRLLRRFWNWLRGHKSVPRPGCMPVQFVVRTDRGATAIGCTLYLTSGEAKEAERSGQYHQDAALEAFVHFREAERVSVWLAEGGAVGRTRVFTRSEVMG